MRNYILSLIFGIMFLFLIANISAVNVANCGTINVSGSYTLSTAINTTGTCLTITNSDIDLDCQGNLIRYGTGGGANTKGIVVLNDTVPINNITIRNCLLITGTASQASHYAISMNQTSNSLIFNNTIRTNGTSNNYGIHLAETRGMIIDNNNLFVRGSTSSNMGIYLNGNNTFTNITNNVILTNGTSTNYAIYSLNNFSNSIIDNNTLLTTGNGASNHGIYLNANASYNQINNNNLTLQGTNTNYGIYVLGAGNAIIENNYINNTIYINANLSAGTGANTGIFLTSYIISNNITNNFVLVNSSTTGIGINVIGAVNFPVNDNRIKYNEVQVWNNLSNSANSFGIQLSANANNNSLDTNNVLVYGAGTDYGIYLLDAVATPSQYNTVNYNNITVIGSRATNHGIYITNSWKYTNITNNIIWNNGTNGNYGISILGLADATQPTFAYNDISNNNISTMGNTTAYGMYISTNVQYSTINNNYIFVNATYTPRGIYLVGTTAANCDFNTMNNNNVNVFGMNITSNSMGINLQNGFNSNLVSNNIINVSGGTTTYGLYLITGTSLDGSFNVMNNNTIYARGENAGANTNGLFLSTNTNNNYFSSNVINVYGNITSYALQLLGTDYPLSENVFEDNIFNISFINSGKNSGTNIMGAYLSTNANDNEFYRNAFNVNTNASGYGMQILISSRNVFMNNSFATYSVQVNKTDAIYLLGRSEDNIFENNIIPYAEGNAFTFATSGYKPENNIFKNNSLVNITSFDVYFRSPLIEGNKFINQPLNRMNFTGKGINYTTFEDTRYGKILFIDYINSTVVGVNNSVFTNMSKNIEFANNYASVNSSNNTGYNLDKSAVVTLYNIPVFTVPTIFRDGSECLTCGVLNNLGGNTFSFTVSDWSYYSILNAIVAYTYNCTIENITAFLTTESICDTLNKTRNSLLASSIYTGFAQRNLSVTCRMDIALSENTGDMMCDLLRHSRESLQTINVTTPISNSTFNYTGTNTSLAQITSYYYTA
jgi:hypothetical protein